MSDDMKTERTSHDVIERKLLLSLSDESKVAVVLTERDLRLILHALDTTSFEFSGIEDNTAVNRLFAGMKRLQKEAFGG